MYQRLTAMRRAGAAIKAAARREAGGPLASGSESLVAPDGRLPGTLVAGARYRCQNPCLTGISRSPLNRRGLDRPMARSHAVYKITVDCVWLARFKLTKRRRRSEGGLALKIPYENAARGISFSPSWEGAASC